jgi:steroid delta-isomerase-like uncharacterized protein
MEALDQILAADFKYHDPHNPEVRTRDDYREYVSRVRTTFPDVHITVEDRFAAGDKVAYRLTFSGTHTGETPGGLAATGNQVSMLAIGITCFTGGKITELWNAWDALTFYRQLGVIPPAE